jgi:hypothetical protein
MTDTQTPRRRRRKPPTEAPQAPDTALVLAGDITVPDTVTAVFNDPSGMASMDADDKFAVLEALEEVIARSSIYKGMALAFIKRHKLYEQLNYTTWQDYLKERWELSRSYAHRLIQTAMW